MTSKVIKISPFILAFAFTVFLLFFHPTKSFSQVKPALPSITIINLIRGSQLGHINDNLAASLNAQWEITSEQKLNATWLLQYSTLENKDIVNLAKNKMRGQEFGLLFEIDRNLAGKSGVLYRGQGEWYFSDGLFLTSYDTSERRKLIDTAFSKFKQTFGYYPKTVGAWWIGADSLNYMQERYGITAALRAADQFNLDFYSIWGTPWSIPYLSSKENQGIPAGSWEDSSKVVVLQWAARDPLKGYKDPLYSIQDYPIKQYDTSYVDYLSSIFLRKPLDNLVFGLENGGTKETFSKYYKTMLLEAKKLQEENKVTVNLVKDYSKKFLESRKVFSDNNYYLSEDYNSKDQSFWYNSGNFRVGIQKIGEDIFLVDLRDYKNKSPEDFSVLSNAQAHLRVDTKVIVDSMRFPQQKVLISKSKEALEVKQNKDSVILLSGNKQIANITLDKVKLNPNTKASKVYNFTSQKKIDLTVIILLGLYLFYFVIVYFYKKNLKATLKEFSILLIPLISALPFLLSFPNFLFDRKELLILQFLPLSFFSVEQSLLFIKIFPFILLFLIHSAVVKNRRSYKVIFIILLVGLSFLYLNVPYFPLDGSTLKVVLEGLFIVWLLLLSISLFIYYKTKSKREFAGSVFVSLIFMMLLCTAIFISRSKYILTPFEIDALNKVKNLKTNVLYVAPQEDYSITAIYKQIKPALNYNYKIAQNLTGVGWNKVVRPGNHILKISNYDHKLIVVPRYLGADLSDYEIELLKLKKVFDNAQIAIFEKK